MKGRSLALAAVVFVVFASCGSNSGDKETVTIKDTVIAAPDTVASTMMDTIGTAAANIPEKTKTVFKEKYPDAKVVKWESEKAEAKDTDDDLTGWPSADKEERHTAWFNWQGNESKAYYDKKSNWVGTEEVISDPAALPAAVTRSIKKEFAGYTISSSHRENDKNGTAYKITLDKGGERIKALIDENGNLLKKKTVRSGN